MPITDPIKYNVNERGRKYRGVDRNFDTVALAKLINSGPVQEMARHGDLVGYWGHWPRELFGMRPVEAGIVDGKVVNLSPAVRTVEVHAEEDGTITHRQEFLDTNEGRLCQRLYASKQGGFSSAITPVRGTMPTIPKEFFGFDYVIEPNYTTNRGHSKILDGVMDDEAMEELALLDAVAGQMSGAAQAMSAVFDALQAQHLKALEAMELLRRENDDLIDGIVSGKGGKALLDSVNAAGIAPLMSGELPDWEQYKSVPLAALDESVLGEPESPKAASAMRDVARRLGISVRGLVGGR
jgi:hypothetical protein